METTVNLQDYRYRPMPTPPQEAIRYAKDRIKDHKHTMAEGYWRKPHLAAWLKQHSQWQASMLSNYDYLKEMQLNGNNIEVENMLKEYNNKKHEWWALGYDFIRELASFNVIPGMALEGAPK